MAINYNNSKIYKIVSPSTDKIYIGSTTQILCKRIAAHLRDYRAWLVDNKGYVTSYEIIKLGDYSIKLLEECNFENRQQLRQREGYFIKFYKDIVVNVRIESRTRKEWTIDNRARLTEVNKQYRMNNKDRTAEVDKQYKIEHKEQIRQYRFDNREHIAEVNKQYRIEHKEQAKQYRSDNKDLYKSLYRQQYQAKINRIWLNELTTL